MNRPLSFFFCKVLLNNIFQSTSKETSLFVYFYYNYTPQNTFYNQLSDRKLGIFSTMLRVGQRLVRLSSMRHLSSQQTKKAISPAVAKQPPNIARNYKPRVCLLSDSYNSMTQRFDVELRQRDYDVVTKIGLQTSKMATDSSLLDFDIVICPFLKTFVPAELYERSLCWIVHPGIVGDRGPSSLDWAVSQVG